MYFRVLIVDVEVLNRGKGVGKGFTEPLGGRKLAI